MKERSVRSRGFTLVELMIALLIFGVLSAAGVALLRFSVTSQAATKERLDSMAELRRLSAVMTADFAQVVPRETRSLEGDRFPAFSGSSDQRLVQFVRAGWSNGGEAPRASLQRVDYRLFDGRIERIAYPMLDGTAADAPAVFFDKVESVHLRFRVRGEWRETWDSTDPRMLPQAVEFTIKPADRAEIRQLFVVGTGY